ncbi:hypothetical protein O0L34_g1708 [Tuta absoluta]|nr:hypothetical protein O0L34_g1708 [Tuta absoluta]
MSHFGNSENKRKGVQKDNVKTLSALGPEKVRTYKRQRTLSCTKTKNDEPNFKKDFETKCLAHISDHRISNDQPLVTNAQIQDFIKRISDGQRILQLNGTLGALSDVQRRLIDNYEVKTNNDNVTILCYKGEFAGKRVIDISMCFDLINSTHSLINHGAFKETSIALRKLHSDVHVPDMAVSIYLSVCVVCKNKKNKQAQTPTPSFLLRKLPATFRKAPTSCSATFTEHDRLSVPESSKHSHGGDTEHQNLGTKLLEPVIFEDGPNDLYSESRYKNADFLKETSFYEDLEVKQYLENEDDLHDQKMLKTYPHANDSESFSIKEEGIKLSTKRLDDDVEEQFKQAVYSHYNKIVFIEIISMPSPDKKFKYILVYLDKQTQYILLRPLMKTNSWELSMELLKIISDFGAPQQIWTAMFWQEILNAFNDMNSNGINLVQLDQIYLMQNYEPFSQYIKDILMNCQQWAIACYILQKELNKRMSEGETPFDKIFTRNFTILEDDLKTLIVSRPTSPKPSLATVPDWEIGIDEILNAERLKRAKINEQNNTTVKNTPMTQFEKEFESFAKKKLLVTRQNMERHSPKSTFSKQKSTHK